MSQHCTCHSLSLQECYFDGQGRTHECGISHIVHGPCGLPVLGKLFNDAISSLESDEDYGVFAIIQEIEGNSKSGSRRAI